MSKSKKVKKTTTKNTTKKRQPKEIWTPLTLLTLAMVSNTISPTEAYANQVPDLTFDELYELWTNDTFEHKSTFPKFAQLYVDYKDGKLCADNIETMIKSYK
jgi:hypothetical protein